MSKLAADLGLCISMFARLRHALRGQDSAVVEFTVCCRMRPQLSAWPNWAVYNNAMRSGRLLP
eukprot:7846844-Pyramimonas_sp.AAC.1